MFLYVKIFFLLFSPFSKLILNTLTGYFAPLVKPCHYHIGMIMHNYKNWNENMKVQAYLVITKVFNFKAKNGVDHTRQ